MSPYIIQFIPCQSVRVAGEGIQLFIRPPYRKTSPSWDGGLTAGTTTRVPIARGMRSAPSAPA